MSKLIAPCGLDCAACSARVATLTNDDALRAKVAEQWSKDYHADITAADINCVGCLEDGVHIGHCDECEIRGCVVSRGLHNCAQCDDFACEQAEQFFQYVPQAKKNLLELG